MNKKIEQLKELVAVQCSAGNWNYDAYMHGLANGMILSLSILENKEPVYLDAPETWLKDIPDNTEPSVAEEKLK